MRILPKNFWDDDATVIQFLDWASKKLNIQQTSDWVSVRYEQLARLGGAGLLQKTGGLMQLLSQYYPDVEWSNLMKTTSWSKGQYYLFNLLKQFFPKSQIFNNYKHSTLMLGQRELEVPPLNISLIFSWIFISRKWYSPLSIRAHNTTNP